MFKVNNKDARTTPISIVNFEEVNADWDGNFQTWAHDKKQTLNRIENWPFQLNIDIENNLNKFTWFLSILMIFHDLYNVLHGFLNEHDLNFFNINSLITAVTLKLLEHWTLSCIMLRVNCKVSMIFDLH